MKKVLVIGGGASGLMAAYAAAEAGAYVTLVEKNEKLGKKIYITGKGRCNVTNASEKDAFFSRVVSNPKFLLGAFHAFSNDDLIRLLNDNGCLLKVERGNRVFPVSDHASDVTKTFERLLRDRHVRVFLNTEAKRLKTADSAVTGAFVAAGTEERFLPADAVVVSTGGLSYPSTGSTGDGYRFAKETGHGIVTPVPSLVPFLTAEEFGKTLAGLTLKNVALSVFSEGRELFREQGELLFTHTGISGPLVLSASAVATKLLQDGKTLPAEIDFKPALSPETLSDRLVREFAASGKKQLKTVLSALVPLTLVPFVLEVSELDGGRPASGILKGERERLIQALKHFPLTITGTGGFPEAVVTKGGVSVRDVRPSDLQSKLISGLYFAGEVLDLDALTGGYNLQIAWSTGYLAGRSAAE